jgi:hypothetical protein
VCGRPRIQANAFSRCVFTDAEWTTAFYRPDWRKKLLLIPVRIEDFDPSGMFGRPAMREPFPYAGK